MLSHMTSNGFLKVGRLADFPDYRAESPEGEMASNGEGRSVEPLVFAGSKLGDWLPNLFYRSPSLPLVGTMTEMRRLAAIRTDFNEFLKAWRVIPRSLWGRLTGARQLSRGAALIDCWRMRRNTPTYHCTCAPHCNHCWWKTDA